MLELGRHDNLEIDKYHGDTSTISKTGLSLILDCPARYHAEYLTEKKEKPKAKHFNLGQAYHVYQLEPHLFSSEYFVIKGKDRRCAEYKHLKSIYDEDKILTPSEFEQIEGMYNAIFRNDETRRLLSFKGQAEVSYLWKHPETGLTLRCRPDFITDNESLIIDLKTTKSAKPSDFDRDIRKYKYLMSAAMTMDGIKAVTGKTPHAYAFVIVETNPNPLTDVIVVEYGSEAYRFGKQQYEKAVSIYADCKRSGIWPGYTPRKYHLTQWEIDQIREEIAYAS